MEINASFCLYPDNDCMKCNMYIECWKPEDEYIPEEDDVVYLSDGDLYKGTI